MATFTERFREALTLRNLTPAELSRLSGIAEGVISRYRTGEQTAAQKNLIKLSTALNVPVDWLIGTSDDFVHSEISFYDTFKNLCDSKGISCTMAALEMGLSNATPTKWKKTGATPNIETLQLIANYFHVSVSDLLLIDASNNDTDIMDIAETLEHFLATMEINDNLMFYGQPLNNEAKDYLISAIKLGLEAAKFKNISYLFQK